jgi:NAD(P)H-dependent FMN reductase
MYHVSKLKKIFAAHDGVFIAFPEYNGSFSPLLKNTLDWISRDSEKNEGSLKAYEHKVIALGAASPGSGGGRSGLIHLRRMDTTRSTALAR